MIPVLSLVWRYRKVATIIGAVLIMSILAWRFNVILGKARDHDRAVAALHKEQEGRELDRKTYLANSIKAEKEAQALAADLGEIRARFANMATVLPKTLVRVVEVPRETPVTSCPEPRVSDSFVQLWNDAGKP